MWTLGPDIIENDGVYSQYVLPLNQIGYYSMICHMDSFRHWPMPSFHVSETTHATRDSIPPSRFLKTLPKTIKKIM